MNCPKNAFPYAQIKLEKLYVLFLWLDQPMHIQHVVKSTSLVIIWETKRLTAAAVMQSLYQSVIGSVI